MRVLAQGEVLEAGRPATGSKAFHLASLARYGFPVPDTFVVPADACRVALGKVAPRDRADLAAISVPASCVRAIEARLRDEGWLETPLAVRSSAIGEDGKDQSFAGIYASRLGVVGLEAVLAAIRECWASLWTESAIAYRRHAGDPGEDVASAVLIGPVVPNARASGVAFSCDPATGRRDFVVIEALPGLAGNCDRMPVQPESWTVDLRAIRPEARKRSRGPGVLGKEEAERLARLVHRVEWALGHGQEPQDVEWVHDGGRFWLVQARPVTALPHPTLPGIRHLPIIWSSANVGETTPGVLRPLAWSTRKSSLDRLLPMALEAGGYELPPGLAPTRLIAGRIRVDLTQWQWAYYDAFGVMPSDLNGLIGGHQPEVPVPAGSPLRGAEGIRRLRRQLRLARAARRAAKNFAQDGADLRREARRMAGEDLAGFGLEELNTRCQRLVSASMAFARRFMVVGAKGAVILLARLLRKHLGEEGTSVASGLLADSGSIASADYGLRLRELAARARESERAEACLHEGDGDWASLPETDSFRLGFTAFLDEFGHRAVYESDIARPRWREDPGYLLSRIRTELERRPGGDREEPGRAARRSAEARLSSLPFPVRLTARWLAHRARRGIARRDCGKSTLVACVGALRAVYVELGRRLARAGHLTAPDDVFDLTHPDLEAFMRGEWDGAGAAELVADRKAQCEAWRAVSPGDVCVLDAQGRKVDFPTQTGARKPAGRTMPASLKGIPASPGKATGRARILSHPDDGATMAEGEVLIAPSTDPSWTPHLFRAAALVTELGGYLSHGTIVARERGLPAVVNVPQATRSLRNGQAIQVDGDRGEIRILSGSGPPLEDDRRCAS